MLGEENGKKNIKSSKIAEVSVTCLEMAQLVRAKVNFIGQIKTGFYKDGVFLLLTRREGASTACMLTPPLLFLADITYLLWYSFLLNQGSASISSVLSTPSSHYQLTVVGTQNETSLANQFVTGAVTFIVTNHRFEFHKHEL